MHRHCQVTGPCLRFQFIPSNLSGCQNIGRTPYARLAGFFKAGLFMVSGFYRIEALIESA